MTTSHTFRRPLLAGGVIAAIACAGLGLSALAATPVTPASSAPVQENAPATIRFACMSNNCGQLGVQNPIPRDADKVAAGVKAGDGGAVLRAGGNASDLLSAWAAQLDTMNRGGAGLRDSVQPGTEQFVNRMGQTAVSYELKGGGHQTLALPVGGFKLPANTPDADELDRRMYGSN